MRHEMRVGDEGLFKFPAPMNPSTGSLIDRPSGQRSTVNSHSQPSIIPNFVAFSCLVIFPLPFSVEIPNFFLSPMPCEVLFLVKI